MLIWLGKQKLGQKEPDRNIDAANITMYEDKLIIDLSGSKKECDTKPSTSK